VNVDESTRVLIDACCTAVGLHSLVALIAEILDIEMGSQSKRRHTQTATKKYDHNGDKLKRQNPKRRQEIVGLLVALAQW